jgi:hypothetical protein
MSPKLKSLILLIILSRPAISQLPAGQYRTFEEFLEVLAEKQGEGASDASFLEELQELHQHPIRINDAELEEILRIPFLNEVTASSILGFRHRYGDFYSVYELASVPGIGRELAEKISWFVTVDTASAVAVDTLPRRKGIQELLSRARITFPYARGFRKEGDKPPAYAGGPLSLYTKYSYEQKSRLSLTLQGDKDPGENFLRGINRKGFDFYSGHASMEMKGIIRRVTVGDYTVRGGQGLVCWQGFSMGKSSDVMQASKNLTSIKPYTSSDETQFFRGIAVSGRIKNMAGHLFLSSRRSDANITVDEAGIRKFTSLQTSGYHRTSSEIEDKKSLRLSTAGILLTLYHQKFKAGFTGLAERSGIPCDPGSQLYERFYFRGKFNFNLSTDYHFVSGRWHLSGEMAISRSGGIAVVQGVEAELHDQLKATILFRSYGIKYHATWSGAFGAGSAANNETGWYAGLHFLPAAGIRVSGYADWFYYPWIKYGTAAPARGHDILLQADFTPNRRFSGYIRYKTSFSPDKVTTGKIYENRDVVAGNLRAHIKYDIRNLLSFTWRAECSGVGEKASGSGILLFHEISWTPSRLPATATLRLSGFLIPEWENRIYTWENDLLYSFSTFSFFGKGFRSYFRTKVALTTKLSLWFKAGITWYPGKEETGSGYAEKEGNIIRDVKIQIRYRF